MYAKNIKLAIPANVIMSVWILNIDQYLKIRAYVKSIIDTLVIPCNKTLDNLETETINSNYKRATYKYFDHLFINNYIIINKRCYLL